MDEDRLAAQCRACVPPHGLSERELAEVAKELSQLLGNPALQYTLGVLLLEAESFGAQLLGVDLTDDRGRLQAIEIQKRVTGLKRAFDIFLEVANG